MTGIDDGIETGPEHRPDDSELSEEERRRLEEECDLAEERAVQGIAAARIGMQKGARLNQSWMGAQDFSNPSASSLGSND